MPEPDRGLPTTPIWRILPSIVGAMAMLWLLEDSTSSVAEAEPGQSAPVRCCMHRETP
jgi:hypothetical protein